MSKESIAPSLPEFIRGAREGRSGAGLGTARAGVGIAALGVAETAVLPPVGFLTIVAGLSMATVGGMVNYFDNIVRQMESGQR